MPEKKCMCVIIVVHVPHMPCRHSLATAIKSRWSKTSSISIEIGTNKDFQRKLVSLLYKNAVHYKFSFCLKGSN